LDIGGNPVKLRLHNESDSTEVPPIPAHVHSGNIYNGINVCVSNVTFHKGKHMDQERRKYVS
jgi:hypothetical protein